MIRIDIPGWKFIEFALWFGFFLPTNEPDYKAKPERILLLHLVAFDWNCPQHITPRFTEAEVAEAVRPLRERLTVLEKRKR